MAKRNTLTKTMSVEEFDNGYWYMEDIKAFAIELGIPSASKLRKDQLEHLIRHFLQTGELKKLQGTSPSKSGIKDTEKGLRIDLHIENYTNNKETKKFLHEEALKIEPGLKKKSGVSYRLNRWREDQINNGNAITYGDLIQQYIKLNQQEGSFEKVPHGRYINFVSDYLANEEKATRKQAIAAWEELKELEMPKDYSSWKKYKHDKK